MSPAKALVSGPGTPRLWEQTLGDLIQQQKTKYGDHAAAVFSWQQNHILSYDDLSNRSEMLARSMLARGLKHGDNIAIMAGNCYQYIEVFLASARIGCPLDVLNNTYTSKELVSALKLTSCKLLFIASRIKLKDLSGHIEAVTAELESLPCILISSDGTTPVNGSKLCTYSSFTAEGQSTTAAALRQAESLVKCGDVLNLQFTSGTTGAPKAAMLTHRNLVNNARFVGAALALTPSDIVCCPPPLFHCFGLVMGFLASFTHGSTIVFPSDQFDPDEVLDSLHENNCTVLLGVPTMFIAEIEANQAKKVKISSVRTALAAGSSVSPALMKQLETAMGIPNMLIAYGMTETSPVTFLTSLTDTIERQTRTVGQVLPHTMAKVVDRQGIIVPRGVRGELCVSGYALQKGYYDNPAKTAEVMKRDDAGTLWMFTGDECVIDEHGYCSVTGRIKDVIIRGGENIFPHEIESRLAEHPSIAEASVIAIKDARYGEVVGAFLRELAPAACLDDNARVRTRTATRPSWTEINQWVRKTLGSHKAPRYVFWIGDEGVIAEFPKTGSGKIMKHALRNAAERLVREGRGWAGGDGAVVVKARL